MIGDVVMPKAKRCVDFRREEVIAMRACEGESIDDLDPTAEDLKAYEDYRAIIEAGFMPDFPFDPE